MRSTSCIVNDKWKRQLDEPLFEQLEWDKPERKNQAGRLLIAGGSQHALGAPAQAFMLSTANGIGTAKVALPNKTKRLLKDGVFETLFLPSTPTGEFSHEGKEGLLQYALWADTVLLCGDVGRNSQSTVLFSDLIRSYAGQIIVTRDSLDALNNEATLLLDRPKTTIVATIAQLQKLFKSSGNATPVTFTMDLTKLVDLLSTVTEQGGASIVTIHNNQIIVASGGEVSTTAYKASEEPKHWRLVFATTASCFQTWYPGEPFKALTHTAYKVKSELT